MVSSMGRINVKSMRGDGSPSEEDAKSITFKKKFDALKEAKAAPSYASNAGTFAFIVAIIATLCVYTGVLQSGLVTKDALAALTYQGIPVGAPIIILATFLALMTAWVVWYRRSRTGLMWRFYSTVLKLEPGYTHALKDLIDDLLAALSTSFFGPRLNGQIWIGIAAFESKVFDRRIEPEDAYEQLRELTRAVNAAEFQDINAAVNKLKANSDIGFVNQVFAIEQLTPFINEAVGIATVSYVVLLLTSLLSLPIPLGMEMIFSFTIKLICLTLLWTVIFIVAVGKDATHSLYRNRTAISIVAALVLLEVILTPSIKASIAEIEMSRPMSLVFLLVAFALSHVKYGLENEAQRQSPIRARIRRFREMYVDGFRDKGLVLLKELRDMCSENELGFGPDAIERIMDDIADTKNFSEGIPLFIRQGDGYILSESSILEDARKRAEGTILNNYQVDNEDVLDKGFLRSLIITDVGNDTDLFEALLIRMEQLGSIVIKKEGDGTNIVFTKSFLGGM